MTLLSIVQNVAKKTRLFDSPATVIGNNSPEVVQALALLDELGDELLFKHDWSFLRKEEQFNTAASTETYAIATVFGDGDFLRLISDTEWDTTNSRKINMSGAQEWQYLKNYAASGTAFTKTIYRRGVLLYIDPVPTAIESLTTEYMSKYWRRNTGGTAISAFSADTDTSAYFEPFMELGLKFKMKKENGVAYADDKNDYDMQLSQLIANDEPCNTIRPVQRLNKPLVNVPDTFES